MTSAVFRLNTKDVDECEDGESQLEKVLQQGCTILAASTNSLYGILWNIGLVRRNSTLIPGTNQLPFASHARASAIASSKLSSRPDA